MVNDERERLSRRIEHLRRLFDWNADSKARAAIIEEIAKHEALIAEMDKTAAPENTAENGEEIGIKAPRDIA